MGVFLNDQININMFMGGRMSLLECSNYKQRLNLIEIIIDYCSKFLINCFNCFK